jgi:hypothetical protein
VSTAFLDAVLPSAGLYCVTRIKNKKVVDQRFCTSKTDIAQLTSTLNEAPWNVYVALASFKSEVREAENARTIKCFFVDIDSKNGKPYASAAEAGLALKQFVKASGLPIPTVVASGGGVHAYWTFTEEVPIAQWRPYARAFKHFCFEHSLKIDAQVSADAARVMRMPGTLNYNTATPTLASLVKLGKPTLFEDLCKLLPAPPADLTAATAFGADDMTRGLAHSSDLPPCEFSTLLDKSTRGNGCAQIKWAYENQSEVPEPLWRAVLSIAWNCTDARTAIHDVSQNHPEYSYHSTLAKAERLTQKPHTCQWFRDNNPELCKGCPQKVTSPIQLGRTVKPTPTVVEDGAEVYVVEHTVATLSGTQQSVTVSIPAFPFPYYRGERGGVYRDEEAPDGEKKPVEIYAQDLYLTGRFYDSDDHGDGEGELLGVCLHLPRDGVRTFYAPATSLLNKEKLQTILLKHGVVAFGKQWDGIMAYFASSIRKLQKDASAYRTRNQMGWTPDELGFVVGEIEYTEIGPKLAPPASSTRQMAPAFQPAGSLDEWKKIANFYDKKGMEPHAFTLFCGFGSPLMPLLGGFDVKGAVVNLVSNESGTGKTTAVMVKDSIFGNPARLLGSADDTYLAKFQHIGMLNNISPSFDEMTNSKPEELSDFIYSVTRGRARHRMDSQANKLRNNNTTWSSIVVTTSNSVFSDAISSIKSTSGGEQARLLDIYVGAVPDISKAEADEIFRKLSTNYGVAGPVFISYVLANKQLVIETLHKMQNKIDEELKLDKADRFYSGLLACAFTGAYFARKLGLFDINIGRVYRHMLHEVLGIRAARVSSVGSSTQVAVETLGRYINEFLSNAIIIESAKNGVPAAPITAPRGALKMRYEPDSKELWIPVHELRTYFVEKQVDVKQSLAVMTKNGMLKNKGKALNKRIGAGAMGSMSAVPVRCYCFDSDAVGMTDVIPQSQETT